MEKSLHEQVLSQTVRLIALDADGKPAQGVPTIVAKPAHWDGGHPIGALLIQDQEVDMTRATQVVKVHGWKICSSKGTELGVVSNATPTVFEPGTMALLSRGVLVPKPDKAAQAQAAS